MAYASSATFANKITDKKFSNFEPKEEFPHAGLYNYNR